MKKNRSQNYVVSYDKGVMLSYLALCLIGLLIMLDVTSMQNTMRFFYNHIFFLAISLLICVLTLYFFQPDKLRPLNPWLLVITIGLLVIVLLQGSTVKGATRRINLGFIGLQPSFIARIALVFYYAGYLDRKHRELIESKPVEFLQRFWPLITFTLITFILVLLEKHLSTLVIAGLTLVGMLTYAGIKKRIIAIALLAGLVAGVGIITLGAEYRSSRIRTYKTYSLLLKNRPAPTNAAEEYQVKESLTALTTGGLLGTGIGRGRAKHYYLPEARTDYVFTIIGEEFGFLGAMLVFGLHCLLFFRAFRLAHNTENQYQRFLCAGLAMNIFFNALVNTGVAMSILPSTGNTLPFISYGGTALLVDSASIGVILNISAKRRAV